jgi:preprotein translocase SecE subunit
MASGIGQYLKETRSELNHVAWPTRTQTIVYAVLVALISLGIAAYLGFFDYVFTTALGHVAGVAAETPNPIQVTQQAATTTVPAASNTFGIPGATPTQ